jgi:glycosyltransferase involved in cell wall biosynthesis
VKVLNVIDTIDPANGGKVTSVLQASSLLKERGNDVSIAALMDQPSDPWSRSDSAKVHCFGPARLRYGYSPGYGPWLRDNARNYDLVVIHGLWQYQGIGTAAHMWKLQRPYAVFAHGMLGRYAKMERIKYLKKLAYWSAVEHKVLSRAAAVIFTTEEEERLARDLFPFGSWNSAIVGCSVDAPPQASTAEIEKVFARFPELRGRKAILFLGRIDPIKGCDILIRAFARSFADDDRMQLVLAGPNSDAAHFRRLRIIASELGVAHRITWTGLVTGTDRSALFSMASLYICASRQENFGFSAVEALAFGMPVIVTDKVNIHGILREARAALVCDDSEEAIAGAIKSWRAIDESELKKLQARQLALWRARFSREPVGTCLENAFLQLASTNVAPPAVSAT